MDGWMEEYVTASGWMVDFCLGNGTGWRVQPCFTLLRFFFPYWTRSSSHSADADIFACRVAASCKFCLHFSRAVFTLGWSIDAARSRPPTPLAGRASTCLHGLTARGFDPFQYVVFTSKQTRTIILSKLSKKKQCSISYLFMKHCFKKESNLPLGWMGKCPIVDFCLGNDE